MKQLIAQIICLLLHLLTTKLRHSIGGILQMISENMFD